MLYLDQPKLWLGEGSVAPPVTVARDVIAASIGNSANYYVRRDGTLFAKGLAHRGQYGDGKLEPTDRFVAVASTVAAVKAYTGHAS